MGQYKQGPLAYYSPFKVPDNKEGNSPNMFWLGAYALVMLVEQWCKCPLPRCICKGWAATWIGLRNLLRCCRWGSTSSSSFLLRLRWGGTEGLTQDWFGWKDLCEERPLVNSRAILVNDLTIVAMLLTATLHQNPQSHLHQAIYKHILGAHLCWPGALRGFL